ncbi:hypothetical protein Pan189_18100 [Stratiformator vulcanicus]|uniref:Uncharacterized protein n=1 Tax=Stratiformator vulcanicus TaxID=2527980 RepID=A0A517R0S1_9PLAN|nr:hypothetical protein Pan189_18100 [Stratiformator vulcanicus]
MIRFLPGAAFGPDEERANWGPEISCRCATRTFTVRANRS